MASRHLAHTLRKLHLQSGQVVLLCTRCGTYAETTLRMLGQPCSDKCTVRRAADKRAFLAKRVHPKLGTKVAADEPLRNTGAVVGLLGSARGH